MITRQRRQESGFTLIELLLAMTFIAFLLLFTVAAVMQVTKQYVKGMAIRQIDQTGRQLVDDVSMALRTGVQPNGSQLTNNRLCVGGKSYVWSIDGGVINRYTDDTVLRFVSVQDATGSLCASSTAKVDKSKSTDLVGAYITPLRFSVTQQGRLWSITLVLSTSGENIAITDASSVLGFSCGTNQFCALGDFETTAYSRGGQ